MPKHFSSQDILQDTIIEFDQRRPSTGSSYFPDGETDTEMDTGRETAFFGSELLPVLTEPEPTPLPAVPPISKKRLSKQYLKTLNSHFE